MGGERLRERFREHGGGAVYLNMHAAGVSRASRVYYNGACTLIFFGRGVKMLQVVAYLAELHAAIA